MTIGNHISVNQILLVEHQMLPDENWSRLEYIVSVELLPMSNIIYTEKRILRGAFFDAKNAIT